MQAKQRWLAGAHLLTVSTSLCSSVKKAASCGSSLELLFGLLFSSVTEAAWLQSFQDSFRARCLVSNSFQAWISLHRWMVHARRQQSSAGRNHPSQARYTLALGGKHGHTDLRCLMAFLRRL